MDRTPYFEAERGSFDVFSVGVTALELLLGIPAAQLLSPTDRDVAIFSQRHPDASPAEAEAALLRLGLRRFCIVPEVRPHGAVSEDVAEEPAQSTSGTRDPAGAECSRAGFIRALRAAQVDALSRARQELSRRTVQEREEGLSQARRLEVAIPREATELALSVAGSQPQLEGLVTWHSADRLLASPDALDGRAELASLQLTTRVFGAAAAEAVAVDSLRLGLPWWGGELAVEDGREGGSEELVTRNRAAARSSAAAAMDLEEALEAALAHSDISTDAPQSYSYGADDGTLGLPSILGESGEDLLWRLLLWDPEYRIRADEALLHPFVHPRDTPSRK